MTSRHVRVFRALLRVYPRRFRSDYRDEMTRLFADQLRDAHSTEGASGVVRLWARTLVDLVATAPGQHLEREEVLVARPIGDPNDSTVEQGGRSRRTSVVVALVPLWLLIGLNLAAPEYMNAIYSNPPSIVGLPAGALVVGLALSWMALGVIAVTRVENPATRLLALLVFTLPATAVIVVVPSAVRFVSNLTI